MRMAGASPIQALVTQNAIYALLMKMRCVGGPSWDASETQHRGGCAGGGELLVVLGDQDGVGWTVEGLEEVGDVGWVADVVAGG